ncbi:MAG: HIT family protein [Rhizobiaceae bacterium]
MTSLVYDSDNIFAKILRQEIPCEKLYEDDHTFAFMDIMPRSKGHCLVIPKAPARNILDCTEDSLSSVIATTKRLSAAVMQAFGAGGVTVLQANETAAGQEVFHLHFHVIPRYEGEKLGPPAANMEEREVLAANADKIRAVLG